MNNKRADAEKKSKAAPVLVGENLFKLPSSPSEKPHLIGNKCRSCGEMFFPSRVCCRHCSSEDMEEILFNPIGKLYSFTTLRVKTPHSIVPVPYMVGLVELEGGEKVRTLLTDCDQSSLEIGMAMELVIETIGQSLEPMANVEVGTDIIGWKFRPARKKQK